jgi:integrase/recombinase XerD
MFRQNVDGTGKQSDTVTRADQIYPLDKNIQRELGKAENDPFNKDVIIRFYKARTFEITKASMLLYLTRLNRMSRLLGKGFEDVTIEDMENLVFEITKLQIADSTKNRTIKILKVFYRWLKKCPKGQFPPEVSWITTKKTLLVTVKSEDLVPFEECVKIAEHATNLRDKTLFLCTLDAGCRIGEILTVRIGEVNFNDYGAVLNSDGKTGEGPLILTWSAKTLAQWINNHPFGNDKNAPLFPKLGSSKPEQLSYQGARLAFKKCVRKAGYGNRRVWLHLFKHVSCTWDYLRGMPQSYRNFKHHWSSTSEMGKVYEHLSNSVIPMIQTWDTKDHERISEKDQNLHELKLTSTCKRCEFENPRDSKYCNRCSFPLNETELAQMAVADSEREVKIKQLLHDILHDPQKLEKLRDFLSETYTRKA